MRYKGETRMKKILFYGDSITYGFDPRGSFGGRYPDTIRWTDQIAQRLCMDYSIEVDAENGREIPSTPRELNDVSQIIKSYLPFDIFAVMLGTNDFLNMYQPNIVEVTTRMKKFLETIRSIPEIQSLETLFLLMAPPYIYTAHDDFYAKYDTTNGIFAKAYRTLASHLGIGFIDTGIWKVEPAYDGIHLSEKGNLIFADRMEETLISYMIESNVKKNIRQELKD